MSNKQRKQIKARAAQQEKEIQKAELLKELEEEKQKLAEENAAATEDKAARKKKRKAYIAAEIERAGGIPAALLMSIFLGLTVLLFAPGEMYVANPVEYQLGPLYILLPMLITACFTIIGTYIILLIALMIHPKVFQVLKHLIFGVTTACWVQMTFLNGRMAQFTGDKAVYSKSDPFFIADLVIFISISVLPLLIWIFVEIFTRKREKRPDSHKLVSALCGLILIMQTAGFLPGLIRVMNNEYLTGKPKQVYQSYEPLMHLNSEQNVVVFLTDRLDSFWVDTTLEHYEDLAVMLDGFTFYQNNLGCYTNTFPALPEMLSGVTYDGQTFGNYVREVWSENKLLPKLKDNGYKVNMILDGPSSYLHLLSMQDLSDNIVGKETGYEINYLKKDDKDGIVPMQAKFAGVKVLPYLLKSLVAETFPSDFSNNFVKWKEDEPPTEAAPRAVGVDADVKCLNYLRNNPVAADSDKKVFNYVHLSCAHETDEKLAKYYIYFDKDGRKDKYATIMGELNVIWEYCKKMKEVGVYDNTTIIILGDHGRAPSLEEEDNYELDKEIVTGLLIKPAGAKRGNLKYDKITPMSNKYFTASVLEYAGIDHSELGLSYNDVIANPPDEPRVLNFYEFTGYYRAPKLLVKYSVDGNARSFQNWKK
ncbi:MAG: sulfatase-like hydrolase/transferase [Oscillospiraceae bacterium]|nr:sulfatase-like hydrolase/transferase [Oscillospiraceae bacterium]